VYSSNGNYLRGWGGWGTGNGQFKVPIGVTVDDFGDVYVSEMFGGRVQKFDSRGNFIAKFGSQGSGTGEFDLPTDICIDSAQKVYVIDQNNNRIQVFRDSNIV
jgi:DNA-binding beta-propeller fold protein YncE